MHVLGQPLRKLQNFRGRHYRPHGLRVARRSSKQIVLSPAGDFLAPARSRGLLHTVLADAPRGLLQSASNPPG